jgi:Icc-related predicted phosphoesterase
MRHMPFDRKPRSLKIFFASDFHGSDVVFRKFLNSLKFYKADVLVFGGDITGKVIVPIIKREGTYYSFLYGRDVRIQNEPELSEFIKVNKNKGYYPMVVTKDEYDELEASKEYRDELFRKLMRERLVEWAQLAQVRLQGSNYRLYWEAGNDDAYAIDEVMDTEACVPIGDRMVELDDYKILGLSHANMTPWKAPRDVSEEKLAEIIDKGRSQIAESDKVIVVYHPPPKDTTIDLAPRVKEDLAYARVGGQQDMIHVGSSAVREAIRAIQPIVGLHGHVHESKGADRIGNTTCINPGSEYTEGILHGALVVIHDREVRSYMLVSG